MTSFMTPDDIARWAPAGRRFDGSDQRSPLREGLMAADAFGPGQTAGRFYPIACVSLEVTQRCNLDCTLCYLSDRAEMARDVPLPILFSRIAMIDSHYGPDTSIQISGGDPTLRKIADLEAICREIRRRGMRSCLMTNGIKATRAMLERLAAAGLDDIAFHVDLTQERAGYATEVSLNEIRADYLKRARGLGLRILFNTTIYDGNMAELPAIAQFFRDHADQVTLASFQMQADTGRGVLRARDAGITQQSVMHAISGGMGADLDFDVAEVGHRHCNRYASVLVAGHKAVSALGDKPLFIRLIPAFAGSERPVDAYTNRTETARRAALRHPILALRFATHALRSLWQLRHGLRASRGRVHRLAILVHNFMDAKQLEAERCAACVFMVMTEEGPISMCVHNARRDDHLFTPARIETAEGPRFWHAATGRITDEPDADMAGAPDAAAIPRKLKKGRWRAEADRAARAPCGNEAG